MANLGAKLYLARVTAEPQRVRDVEGEAQFFVFDQVVFYHDLIKLEKRGIVDHRIEHITRNVTESGIGQRRVIGCCKITIVTVGFGFLGIAIAKRVLYFPVVNTITTAYHNRDDFLCFNAVFQAARVFSGFKICSIHANAAGVFIGFDLDSIAYFIIFEITVQGANVVLAIVVWAPVHIEGGAKTLSRDLIIAKLRLLGVEIAIGFGSLPAPVMFQIVRAEVPILVSDGAGNRQTVLRAQIKNIAISCVELRAPFLYQVVVAALEAEGVVLSVFIEPGKTADFDSTANCIAIHVWRERLTDLEVLQQVRGHHIECHRALISVRRCNVNAVNLHGVETGFQSANANEAPFALVTLNKHAGGTLQSFGNIGIGQCARITGGNHTGNVVIGALLVDRAGLLGALPVHKYVFKRWQILPEPDVLAQRLRTDYEGLLNALGAHIINCERITASGNIGKREPTIAAGGRSKIE